MEYSGVLPNDAPDPAVESESRLRDIFFPVMELRPQRAVSRLPITGFSETRGADGVEESSVLMSYTLWRFPDDRTDPRNEVETDEATRQALEEEPALTPSAMNTALALRQAIWRKPDPTWVMCGIPDILHVDHAPTSPATTSTALALRIRILHSAVGRPQGRGKIERFFGTVNTELLATLPGHLAPCARHPAPALTPPELDLALGSFITAYNQRTHRAIGASPRGTWVGQGWLPRMPESLDQLDGLLLTVPKLRTVHRDGIHFQGQRYLAPTLAPFVGHTVTIRYDPRDLSEIRVYDHDTFVCVAVDEAHPNDRLSLNDIERARRARCSLSYGQTT